MDNFAFSIGDIMFHSMGVVAAIYALFKSRSPQGAVAWIIGLLLVPKVTVPFYLIFGLNRFRGYVRARKIRNEKLHEALRGMRRGPLNGDPSLARPKSNDLYETLAGLPFVPGNRVQILKDGEETFETIFRALDEAQSYILISFYIVRDDELGRQLAERVDAAVKRGVKVYMLIDALGSRGLSSKYIRKRAEQGVEVRFFRSSKAPKSRIQANFRNHRKVVVVDGVDSFIGGLNVGNEYLGKSTQLGKWRDTFVQINGGATLVAQMVFLEDWYWSTDEVLDLSWKSTEAEGPSEVLMIPTGPADEFDTCGKMFVHSLNTAQRRIWIASPYFVPGAEMMGAIHLALLRGVDVRFLVSGKSDSLISKLASETYVAEALSLGAKMYSYQEGFMHQKIFLIDDELSSVSTANFDIRSFALNFEITALVRDREFATQVERVFLEDFKGSKEIVLSEFLRKPFFERFLARAARLMTPIL